MPLRMLPRAAVVTIFGLVIASAGQGARAQIPGAKIPGTNAKVPDMTGIWERAEGIRFNPSNELPPFSPEFAAKYTERVAARARGEVVADPTSRCLPQGMPRFMVASYPLEVLQTRGQVTIIAEWSSQVRRIFTDGRPHPAADEVDITFNGHSIGHWEGQTLMVDTVGIRGDTSFDASPLEHSDKIHVTEKIWLAKPDLLVDEITVTDPVAFTKPWAVTRHYKKGGPDLQIMEYVCEENNREIILPGQMTKP